MLITFDILSGIWSYSNARKILFMRIKSITKMLNALLSIITSTLSENLPKVAHLLFFPSFYDLVAS